MKIGFSKAQAFLVLLTGDDEVRLIEDLRILTDPPYERKLTPQARPNVLYEAGYSHALPRPTVHICSTPLSELPFDVRNWNTIKYKKGQTTVLRDPLIRQLQAALGR